MNHNCRIDGGLRLPASNPLLFVSLCCAADEELREAMELLESEFSGMESRLAAAQAEAAELRGKRGQVRDRDSCSIGRFFRWRSMSHGYLDGAIHERGMSAADAADLQLGCLMEGRSAM